MFTGEIFVKVLFHLQTKMLWFLFSDFLMSYVPFSMFKSSFANFAVLIFVFILSDEIVKICTMQNFQIYGIKALQCKKYIPSSLVKMDCVVFSPHPTAVQACTETVYLVLGVSSMIITTRSSLSTEKGDPLSPSELSSVIFS